jgi:hypothetical protein
MTLTSASPLLGVRELLGVCDTVTPRLCVGVGDRTGVRASVAAGVDVPVTASVSVMDCETVLLAVLLGVWLNDIGCETVLLAVMLGV